MLRLIAVPALLVVAGTQLATEYEESKPLRVEAVASVALETTSFEMTVDGEQREPRGGGGGASEETRSITYVDEVLEADDGTPTRVKRAFEAMTLASSMSRGETSRDDEREGALHEVTLELALDEDGDVEAEVTDGNEPDNEEALADHRLTFALDAFLPEDDVESGATWDLENGAIRHALGFDVVRALFPRPEPDDSERGEGRRGGRRFGGGRGGSGAGFLYTAEWEGTAELVDEGVDFEGHSCAVIALELETSGEIEEPEREGRRRDFMAGASSAPFESSYSAELEGKLYFSTKLARPVGLRLEGTVTTDRNMERDFNGRSMSMSSTREGTFKYDVTITEAESE